VDTLTDVPSSPPTGADDPRRAAPRPLVGAGIASLGAGAIHAAAIGVHSEHRQAVVAFTVVAALQIGWGALALVRGGRLVAGGGLLISAAAVGGWLLAKTTGIGFVDGLEEVESVQWADGAAAAMAAVAAVACLAELVGGALPARREQRVPGPVRAIAALAVVGLSFSAMVSAGSHSHAGGHDEEAAGHAGDHGGGDHAADAAHAGDDHPDAAADDHPHEGAVVPPRAYDPELPIDLSGIEGVTPEEQARAENLIAITLIRLPQWDDPAVAEAAGFRSIGDGFTGHEHFINWDHLSDGRILDPDHPESLVYERSGGERKLVSAMFMLERGTTLDDVPEVGGELTQWHIHDDLCFTAGDAPQVRGITSVGGSCQPPLQKLEPVPMIHVWITPHPCGPFAALEGVGAGQIAEGEERLCDHVHGAGG
jgi:hypothetical protein